MSIHKRWISVHAKASALFAILGVASLRLRIAKIAAAWPEPKSTIYGWTLSSWRLTPEEVSPEKVADDGGDENGADHHQEAGDPDKAVIRCELFGHGNTDQPEDEQRGQSCQKKRFGDRRESQKVQRFS